MLKRAIFRSTHSSLVAVSSLIGLIFAPFPAHAVEVNGIAKLGEDFGGGTMVKVAFVSGGTSSIKGNEGLLLAGGVSINNDARNFFVDATYGWKNATLDAANQSFDFTRYPLDVVAFYGIPFGNKIKINLRIGGGLTYVMNPTFSASGTLVNGTVKFEDALGFVGQVDTFIKFSPRLGVNAGLRLTNVDYSVKGVPGSVNGSGAGLFVAFVF